MMGYCSGLTGAVTPSPERERNSVKSVRSWGANVSQLMFSTFVFAALASAVSAGGCFASSTTGRPSELQMSMPATARMAAMPTFSPWLSKNRANPLAPLSFAFMAFDSGCER